MKIKILILFCLLAFSLVSQITNTRKWRYTERDSLDNGLLLYDEANYKIALPIFEKIHENHPNEEFIKYLYGICCLYRSDKYAECLAALSAVYAKNTNIDMIEFDLARAYHYNYKFDEALEMVNKHLSYKRMRAEDKAKGVLLKNYILNAKRYNSALTKAKISNTGAVNTAGDEYSPAIPADESVLVFNYTGPNSKGGKQNVYLQPDVNGFYNSDIYSSKKQNNQFQQSRAMDNLNTNANETVVSLSHDAQVLFTYKDITDGHGDIYVSYLKGDVYSQPAKLKGKVNSYSWEGHASLSPDGRTLYFSSERSGGYGGKDLYKAKLMADSTWGNIVNLGDSINTPYDEDAPFIHADGTTLFYSSKGLKSSGGYDIFRTEMNRDSTFKKTGSVGYPINTPDDDIYFVLTASGDKGYYSSGRAGGSGLSDIYTIEPAFEGNRPSLFLLKGDIAKGNDVADAEIKVELISNNNAVYKKTRSNKGKYLVTLPAGAQYRLTFAKTALTPQTYTVSTIGINGFVEKIYNVNFEFKPDTARTIALVNAVIAKVTPTVAVSKTISTPTIASAKTVTTISVAATKTVAPTILTPTPAVAKTPTQTAVVSTLIPIKTNTASNTASTVAVTKVPTPTVAVTKTSTPAVIIMPTVAAIPTPTKTIVAVTKTITPTVVIMPTVAATPTPTKTIVAATKTVVPTVTSTITAVTTTSFTPPARPANMTVETFIPLTAAQEKIRIFTEKYPDVSADSLDFRVQIAAFKFPKVYEFPHLKECGRLENLLLEDGITRITIGGSFKTLRTAYQHNKKVVVAGQNDAFVTVIYKRRRLALEELENMGIFKKK